MKHALNSVPDNYSLIELQYGPYSASRLIVARCPARFMSKYIRRDLIVSDALASSRGSAIHEVLQKITERNTAGEEISPMELVDWVSEAVGKFPASYEQAYLIKEACVAYIGNPSPYANEDTLCEVALAVKKYSENLDDDLKIPQTLYTKAEYQDESGRIDPGIYFGARIDQLSIDEDARIVTILDHKSTPSANANADHDFQMGCYAWLASLHYPGYRIRTVLHYAHPRLNFYASPVYWEAEDLEDIEQEISTRIDAIESFQEFPSLPGGHCDYCHMTQECPELRQVQAQNAKGDIDLNIRTVDDMVRVARQLRVTGVLHDQLNKKLKEAIETLAPDGGVAIEGMFIGFKVGEEKVDWSATERKMQEETAKSGKELDLAGFLEKHGYDSDAFKDWRAEKLRGLLKHGSQTVIEELKPYIVTERSTRFGSYKA